VQSRRSFLSHTTAVICVDALCIPAMARDDAGGIPLSKPALPFVASALAPYISAETVDLHFAVHHLGYYDKLATLAGALGWDQLGLEEIIRRSHGRPNLTDIYNAASQTWNHNFYWQSSRAAGGSKPSERLLFALERDCGGFERMRETLVNVAMGHFGSGWAWLATDDAGRISIVSTHDADSPASSGLRPLLCVDVWEHAYYIDHRNRRQAYATAVVQHLANWEFASERYRS